MLFRKQLLLDTLLQVLNLVGVNSIAIIVDLQNKVTLAIVVHFELSRKNGASSVRTVGKAREILDLSSYRSVRYSNFFRCLSQRVIIIGNILLVILDRVLNGILRNPFRIQRGFLRQSNGLARIIVGTRAIGLCVPALKGVARTR